VTHPTSSYTLLLKTETRPYIITTRWILIILKILLIPVLAIIRIPFWWALALVLAVVSLIEYHALQLVPSVQFSLGNISFNGIVRKKYPWSAFDNVILKDGLLTIDFKDNRLFQKEIQTATDEQAFNAWCNARLYELKG
jgi:hypothetical protein